MPGAGGAAEERTGSQGIRENLTGTRQEKPFRSEPNHLVASLSDSEALIHFNSCCQSFIMTPLNPIWELTVIHSAISGCRFLGMPQSGEGREPVLTPSSVFRNVTWAPKSANPSCVVPCVKGQVHVQVSPGKQGCGKCMSVVHPQAPDGGGPMSNINGVYASSPLHPHGCGPSSFIHSFIPIHSY